MSQQQGWGQPQQGFAGGQPPPPAQSNDPSGLAWAALICGAGSWVMLPFVAAVAGVIIGKIELGKIERGESSPAGKTVAQIGYYASIANIVVTLLATIGTCCMLLIIPMFFAGAAAGSSAY